MRELLLLAIVIPLCCVALVKPRLGLYGYLWFALMRPDVLAWSSTTIPYSLALAVSTLLGSLPYVSGLGVLFSNPLARWLLLLQIPVGVSVLSAQVPALSAYPYSVYVRLILMALLILRYVQTEQHLRQLVVLIAFSLGFLGSKFGVYGLLHGGVRLMGGYEGTMLSDNNTLALALAMAIPLCWYSRALVSARWAKLMFLGMVFANIAAIIMTHSRGAAVSLLAAFLLIIWRAKRRLAILALLAVLCAPALYMMRTSYFDRLATLQNPEEDASAYSRLEYQKAALAMWKDYPWFGVGFGMNNYVRLVPQYLGRNDIHVAHNTYLQMLVDSGVFAFLIYVGLLVAVLVWLGKSAKETRQTMPSLEVYPMALQASLAAFAVGSTFVSRVEFDLFYILLAAAASWQIVYREQTLQNSVRHDEFASAELQAGECIHGGL